MSKIYVYIKITHIYDFSTIWNNLIFKMFNSLKTEFFNYKYYQEIQILNRENPK